MKQITQAQYDEISHCFPTHRGNVTLANLHVLNALLYVAENGCKWRALPSGYGDWHTVYTRVSRWFKDGVWAMVFAELRARHGVEIRVEAFALDSTTVKVHPDGAGALRRHGPQSLGRSRGGLTTKIHVLGANDREAVDFSLSAGNAHDDPQGRALLSRRDRLETPKPLLMDKAYEGDEMRRVARKLGYKPTVPPRANRKKPWRFSKKLYRRRNEIERLFRNLKSFRRIFTRYDKLDVIYRGFIFFALSVMLFCVNTP